MPHTLTVACAALLVLPTAHRAAAAAREADAHVIDDFSCTTEAARKLWRPMADTAEVSVIELDGRRALKMPCNFRGARVERASWDRTVALDLSGRKGVRFRFRCADTAPVSGFTMYLHSGEGWYRGTFHPVASDGWQTIEIRKSATAIEGAPGGWGRIDTLRISAWRGGKTDTVFYLAELSAFGKGGRIVVVRGDSGAAAQASEAEGIKRYAEVMARFLDAAGVDYTVLSDRDLTAERLERMKVAILPYNPSMPEKVADELAGFVRGGGKLLACYTLPRKLRALVGIGGGRHVSQKHRGYFASIRGSDAPLRGAPPEVKQASWNIHEAAAVQGSSRVAAWWHTDAGESTRLPAIVAGERGVYLTHVLLGDDAVRKQRLLLAMLGHLDPDVWREAAEGAADHIGQFEPYRSFEAAAAGIRAAAGDRKAVRDALAEAGKLRERAVAAAGKRAYPEAVHAAGRARQVLIEAHCLAQRPKAGEHRAIWCHSAFGVAGMSWDEAIRTLADNGFTAVLPNMLWGGVAYYESDVLPVSPEVRRRGDQVALCAAACRKHGVECHVWKVNFNMGSRTPRAFAEKMKAAGRTQVRRDGSPNDRWLCPSHPGNRRLEIDSMLEVARKYDVHGVHFDYIRYPGRDGCFCAGCRTRFEKALGRKVADWPADLRNDPALHDRWMDFRREQITAVVAGLAERLRKVKPRVKISAAVFRNWPGDRNSVGQDWKLWCDRGYLDFVCPMDYTAHSGHFEQMVRQQLRWAGKVPCCPGIGLSVWPDRTDAPKLIRQIGITRELGTKGFTIFNYDPPVAREVLPLLGKGMTEKR